MAHLNRNNPLNAAGSVFTDTTCINCGTCYHLAPRTFQEQSNHSIVVTQPQDLSTWGEVKRAIVSCPTNSIGIQQSSEEFKLAPLSLPLLIESNVYYCGYTSEDSFGATTYLIQRPEGNILIDSPRFHPLLIKELERMGGVAWMILTHRDDVADHQQFREHFKLQRVIHQDELTSDTKDCEIILEGEETQLLKDLLLITVPGHTKGHIVALYQQRYLFTGDHLFVESDHSLSASRNVCWYNWSAQIESTKKLASYPFSWILPGHGGWDNLGPSAHSALGELIKEMEQK